MRSLAVPALVAFVALSPAPAEAGVLDKLIDAPVRKIFKYLAAKKGDRVFHAQGLAYHATFEKDGKVKDAIVRISRGGAASKLRPDILGIAVKTAGEHGAQDFLMVSAKSAAGIRARIPTFGGDYAGRAISSLTSFKADGVRGAITATLPAGFKTPLDLDAPGVASEPQSFSMTLRQGGWLRRLKTASLGTVTVDFTRPLSAEENATLRYTPYNAGAGVEPVGFINRVRRAAYIGSQEGRGLKP